jgi:hypothetical protein
LHMGVAHCKVTTIVNALGTTSKQTCSKDVIQVQNEGHPYLINELLLHILETHVNSKIVDSNSHMYMYSKFIHKCLF